MSWRDWWRGATIYAELYPHVVLPTRPLSEERSQSNVRLVRPDPPVEVEGDVDGDAAGPEQAIFVVEPQPEVEVKAGG